MYLLDSNTCIRFLNGRSIHVERRLRGAKPTTIKLCSIVKAELLYGAARSDRSQDVLAKLNAFFTPYDSIPFDDDAAAQYGLIRARLANTGTPIGPNDLMIAAVALSRQLILVTHNTGEFSRVAGLSIEDWEAGS